MTGGDREPGEATAGVDDTAHLSPVTRPLTLASHNIHKGLSHFNRRVILDELKSGLHSLKPDIVFLQEVQGQRSAPVRRHHGPPVVQHEFLRGDVYSDVVYGQNATYDKGHHGNAVLSRFPVLDWENIDISHHRMESRGLLHTRVRVPGWPPLHAVCVHLGLFAKSRRFQMNLIAERIDEHIPEREPLILAGDFNDWRGELSTVLERELGIHEAFAALHGSHARTFPARLPMLPLDRIYVRGLKVTRAEVLGDAHWAKLSDHAGLFAEVALG